MIFHNLTPHPIRILDLEHRLLMELPPVRGKVARVDLNLRPTDECPDGVTVFEPQPGDGVVGLPEPMDGVGYVVSAMVREAVPHRRDVYSLGELVRDANGQPKGCLGLIRNAPKEGSPAVAILAIGAGIWLVLFVAGKLIQAVAGK